MLDNKTWLFTIGCAVISLVFVLLGEENGPDGPRVAEVGSVEGDMPNRVSQSSVTNQFPLSNEGGVLTTQSGQPIVADATEAISGGASTDYGPFVDPADESTWKRLPDDAKRNFGPAFGAMDPRSKIDRDGVREYGLYIDPESPISRLSFDGKAVEFGRFVDPEDPYSWRRQNSTPVEYGADTTQDFTDGI